MFMYKLEAFPLVNSIHSCIALHKNTSLLSLYLIVEFSIFPLFIIIFFYFLEGLILWF